MNLKELYQEEPGSTFTNDDHEYDLNKVLADVDDLPKVLFFTNDLKWVLDYDKPHRDRIAKADLNAPILVTYYEDKFVVIDGLHRLAKAVSEKKRFMRGIVVPQDVLENDEVVSEQHKRRIHMIK